MQTSSLDFDPAAARSIKRAIKAGNSLLVISGKLQKIIPKPALIFSDNFPGWAACLEEVALKTSAKPAPRNGTSKDAAPVAVNKKPVSEQTCIPGHLSYKSLSSPRSPVLTQPRLLKST